MCRRWREARIWKSWPGPICVCRGCRKRSKSAIGSKAAAAAAPPWTAAASPGVRDRYQEYAYTFRGILADVHFDVAGGDDRVRDLLIQAVDSPTISQMMLECELPAYIGVKKPPLPVTGVMQIPMGSRVTVRAGEASKELVRVQIGGSVEDRPMPVTVLEQSDLAADHRGFSYGWVR